MLTGFFLFLCIVINNILITNAVCLWSQAASDGENNELNGYYVLNGEFNDHPYFVLDHSNDSSCSIPKWYLYYYSNENEWWINNALDNSGQYYAHCNIKNLQYPYLCGANWIISPNSNVNTNVEVTNASCPNIGILCSNLRFSYADNKYNDTNIGDKGLEGDPCPGDYSSVSSESVDNVWFRYDSTYGNVYIFFDEKQFRWVCSNKFYDGCTINGYYKNNMSAH